MKFNINDTVKVKLTEYGIKILRDKFEQQHKLFPTIFCEFAPPEQDENGYSEFQLWVLMRDFGGELMTQLAPNTFGNWIEIPEEKRPLKVQVTKKDLSHAMMEAGAFINRNRDKINVLELITTLKNGEWEIVVSYTEK